MCQTLCYHQDTFQFIMYDHATFPIDIVSTVMSIHVSDTKYVNVYPINTSEIDQLFENQYDNIFSNGDNRLNIDIVYDAIFLADRIFRHYHQVMYKHINENRMIKLINFLEHIARGCFNLILCRPALRELHTMWIYLSNLVDHKIKYFKHLHDDLLQAVHKRKYFKSLKEELLQVAWSPRRMYDWCLDENEKSNISKYFFPN